VDALLGDSVTNDLANDCCRWGRYRSGLWCGRIRYGLPAAESALRERRGGEARHGHP